MSPRPKMSKSRPTETAATKTATVEDLESAIMNGNDKAPKKRLILDIPATLHARIKVSCAARDVSMVKEITAMLETKYQ